MQPVMQTIVDEKRGDCWRAVIASLFDLDISQVPHFLLFPHEMRGAIYRGFLKSIGWNYVGVEIFDSPSTRPQPGHGVGGYFAATVYSRTNEGARHCVIIDGSGLVVHDPNPNRLFNGANVIDTTELIYWDILRKENT